MIKFSNFFANSFAVLVIAALAYSKGAYQRSFHIESNPVTVDLSEFAGCTLKFTTTEDKILAFHHIEGAISELREHIKIRDGLELRDDYITFEKSENEDEKRLNVIYDKTVYSSGIAALVEVGDQMPPGLHLKVSKAVECPFNLGVNTQCGRVFDDLSCYCASYVQRNWTESRKYCVTQGFYFLSLETREEEVAVQAAWGTTTPFWISLNDIEFDNVWIWESTGQYLYPGYANWNRAQPDNGYNGTEDCVAMNSVNGAWNDLRCNQGCDTICELQP